MSGYQGTPPPGGNYYPPPPDKGGYGAPQSSDSSQQQQYFAPPPGGQSYPPPPPSSPPAQIPGQQQQQHYPPPPGGAPAGHPHAQPHFSPPPPDQSQFQPSPQQQQHFPPPGSAPPQPQSPYGAPPNATPHPGMPPQQVSHQSYTGPPPQQQQQQHQSERQAPPPQQQAVQASQPQFVDSTQSDDVGTFNGGSYRISHRNTNSILTIQLASGCPLTAKPGALIAMTPTITLKGSAKFTLKKYIAGGELSKSTYTGPGELLLAPATLGDITVIGLTGQNQWSVGKDAFLACTQGVVTEYKSQSLSKAIFSGEGLFVYRITGQGILWCMSFGAIIRKDLKEGEKYYVDNGYLVAWNCKYVMERVASGGIVSNYTAGEGLVCKFTGPGAIFMQTRNAAAFTTWLSQNAANVAA
ncbi:unnamed protein product [Periconia digitata]|uniref:Altered inheritance of mitochondria protein 24, mitochondrial n=1 Tax=Periconia digitata TaxID=1303443 RepID=A0A9W4UDP7_9PLEO|nr:unnamed protein product [Periconia digitata]